MKQYEASYLCKQISDHYANFRSGVALTMIDYHRGRRKNSKQVKEVITEIDYIAAALQNIKSILKEL